MVVTWSPAYAERAPIKSEGVMDSESGDDANGTLSDSIVLLLCSLLCRVCEKKTRVYENRCFYSFGRTYK